MLRGITFVVMIFLCLLTTSALEGTGSGQFTSTYSIVHSMRSLSFFWVFLAIPLIVVLLVQLACLGLKIFFRLGVIANFAITFKAVFARNILIKFRNWLDLFAVKTLFCYDFSRHLLLLVRSKCSGLTMRPILVASSSYFNSKIGGVK